MRLGFVASLTATLVFAAAPALARDNAMIELMGHKLAGKGRPTEALRACKLPRYRVRRKKRPWSMR